MRPGIAITTEREGRTTSSPGPETESTTPIPTFPTTSMTTKVSLVYSRPNLKTGQSRNCVFLLHIY